MKKQLLSVLGVFAVGAAVAQTVSPAWSNIQNPNFPQVSTGIRFIDAVDQNVVWTIGYDGTAPNRNYNWFARTTNGGSTFNNGVVFTSTLTPAIGDTTTYQISNLCGVDANTAWICAFNKVSQGNGALYKTANGGANWVNVTPPGMYGGATAFANFVTFLTPSVGICNGDPVGGEFELWRTIDGGTSWTQISGANIPNPNANEYAIVDLYAKQGTSNLWYATNQGRMYRTNDAGLTWNVSTVCPPTTTVVEIAFASPLNGVVFAVDNTGAFRMYNTTDGGVNWSQITPVSANVGRNDIVAVPGTGAYASCGAGNGNTIISYSYDNGVTWTDWGGSGIQYLTLDFVSSTTGWAGSFSNASDPSIEGIFKYTGSVVGGTVTPTAAFTIPSYTCGPNASITPSNVSTGSGALSYTWSVSPAATVASPNASSTSISFSGANSYTITLTVSSALGTNSSSQIFQVLSCTPPVANFSIPSTVCKNAVVTVTNSSVNNPAATYSWSTLPTTGVTYPNTNSVFAPLIKFGSAGVYTVVVVATNISGTVSATQTINVNDCSPDVNTFTVSVVNGCAGRATIAGGIVVDSSAVVFAGFPGHQVGNTYTWTIQPSTGVVVFNNGAAGKRLEISQPGTYVISLTAGNVSGIAGPASRTVTVNDCAAVGIKENNLLGSLVSVFPNPAHDLLNVSLPSSTNAYSVKLISIIGTVVYEEKTNKENFSIQLADKAKGVYFLSVENNGEKAIKKIVIE